MGGQEVLEVFQHIVIGDVHIRDAVRDAVRGAPRPRVLAIEWLDPPFLPGHWVPEMIEAAALK